MKKFPIILFFVAGSEPTAAQQAESFKLGPNVRFRNAEFVSDVGSMEACDGVAGDVPARYADAYPTAEDALKKYADEFAAEVEGKDDSAAAEKAAVKLAEQQRKAADKEAAKQAAKPAPAAPAEWKAN